jgi:pimeloyl-ACP methyl ester carboxylesterase
MGGYVALSLLRRHPESVAGLGLVDTRAAADDEAGKKKRDAMIELVRREGPRAVAQVADQMLPNLLAESSLERDPGLRERVRRMMMEVPPATLEQAALAMRDRRDERDLLPGLRVPVAVVVGAQDQITPLEKAGFKFAEGVAQTTIVPESGHLTPVESPEVVAEALEGLMRRVGS